MGGSGPCQEGEGREPGGGARAEGLGAARALLWEPRGESRMLGVQVSGASPSGVKRKETHMSSSGGHRVPPGP